MKNNLKYIGENIRIARKSKNLTIDTLSELIGISSSFLGTLERGESSLSVETLISVCKALGVSADSIIFDRSVTPEPSIIDKKDTIITLLNNATDDELSFLIDYIKLYREKVVFKNS
jgi:transcriptional regulator with XRE-family HTH domain